MLSGLVPLRRASPLLESSRVLLLFLILRSACFGILAFGLSCQMILLLYRDYGLILRLIVTAEVSLRAKVVKLD